MPAYTRTVLITGGTTGLGFETALKIAHLKPEYLVLIASRSNSDDAAKVINKKLGQNNVLYVPLDLSSLAGVRQFATSYSAASYPPIAALILNAGVQSKKVQYSADGIEKTFAVNHIGHALLFYLLRPFFAQKTVRVIITASGVHDPAQKVLIPKPSYVTAEQVAHPSEAFVKKNDNLQSYSTSKLCNVLWSNALHNHLSGKKSASITVNAFDPGLVPGTKLAREYGVSMRFLWNKILPRIVPLLRLFLHHNIHTASESGEALARLAVSSDLEGVSGRYFEGKKEIRSSKDSYDKTKQRDIWDWTINFIASDEEERQKFNG